MASSGICEDTANFRSDTINRYSFTEDCLRGAFHEKKQDYDLMTVVVLRLGSKGENSEDNAIRLLSKMFSTDLSYKEKIDSLQNEGDAGKVAERNFQTETGTYSPPSI